MTEDPWEVLGLARSAPTDVIEAAYGALRKRLHPDAGGGANEFQRIQTAYDQLRDPEMRGRLELGRDNAGLAFDVRGNARDGAAVLLMQTMGLLTEEHLDQGANVMEMMRNAASMNVQEKRAKVMERHKEIAKLTRVRRGLKRRKGQANVLGNVLDSEIEKMRKTVPALEADAKFAAELHTFVCEFEFQDRR